MSINERITPGDIAAYKQNILEQSVLVAPSEAARILSVSESTVNRLVRDGEIHGYNRKRGSRGMRILAAELRDYVQSIKIDKDFWRE